MRGAERAELDRRERSFQNKSRSCSTIDLFRNESRDGFRDEVALAGFDGFAQKLCIWSADCGFATVPAEAGETVLACETDHCADGAFGERR